MIVRVGILLPAEAAISPSNRPHHPHPLLPCPEVVIDIRWELQSVEVSTDQPVGVILRISGEYLSIAAPSPIVL